LLSLTTAIAGSNTAAGVGVCFDSCVFVKYKSLREADHSSRGVLLIAVCLSVIVRHS